MCTLTQKLNFKHTDETDSNIISDRRFIAIHFGFIKHAVALVLRLLNNVIANALELRVAKPTWATQVA